jgi:hypothetical protein
MLYVILAELPRKLYIALMFRGKQFGNYWSRYSLKVCLSVN